MLKIAILSLITLAFFSCKNEPKGAHVGLWKLQSMQVKNAETGEWSEYRGGMQGYLLYDDDQYMSLHLQTKDYYDTDLAFSNFTDTMALEQLQHITMNYNYMGQYEIDLESQIVQHTRLSHSNPNDVGEIVKRRFHFVGDTLVIQPFEKKNARLKLKWLPN